MKTVIAIVVVIVLALGGYFFFAQKTQAPVQNPTTVRTDTSATVETTNPNVVVDTTVTPPSATALKTVTVSYNGTSFSPKSVSIKKGDTVKFVSTGAIMWVASAMHPAHVVYSGTTKDAHCPDTSGTAFDQCGIGGTYNFTFGKVGSWGYHNHVAASNFGMVVVTE